MYVSSQRSLGMREDRRGTRCVGRKKVQGEVVLELTLIP